MNKVVEVLSIQQILLKMIFCSACRYEYSEAAGFQTENSLAENALSITENVFNEAKSDVKNQESNDPSNDFDDETNANDSGYIDEGR